jgi:hypothetical protein
LKEADESQAAAMALSGDKRIEALKKSIELLKGLPEQVTEGDDVLISRQEVYERISNRAVEWQKEAEAAKQAQLDTAQTAAQTLAQEMARAETAMATLEKRIVDLDGKILSLSRSVILTLDDQVTAGVENIRRALSSLGSGVNVSGGSSYVNVIPGAVSLSSPSSFALDSYAKGTNYVPKTGLYQLHEGEAVLTVEDNLLRKMAIVKEEADITRRALAATPSRTGYYTNQLENSNKQLQQYSQQLNGGSGGSTTVTFSGDINLNLPNVTNQSTGADLAREAMPELIRLMKTRFKAA